MNRTALGSFVLVMALGVAPRALAQDPAQMPPMAKPVAEHEMLKHDVGVWDAVVEMAAQPGMPAVPSSKGVETNVMMGGLWLVSDFKSEMMGMPFEGHGVFGYDPAKKKYVGTWVDTMSTYLGMSESEWDASTKTLTGWMDMPDPSGKMMRTKMTTTYPAPGNRVMIMYSPDGKEMMRITYTRRK